MSIPAIQQEVDLAVPVDVAVELNVAAHWVDRCALTGVETVGVGAGGANIRGANAPCGGIGTKIGAPIAIDVCQKWLINIATRQPGKHKVVARQEARAR